MKKLSDYNLTIKDAIYAERNRLKNVPFDFNILQIICVNLTINFRFD